MRIRQYTALILALITIPLHADLIVPTLETERCILRPLSLDDAPALFSLASDPVIARYTTMFGQALHQTHQETRAFIQQCLTMQQKGYGINWVIIAKENNTLIGLIHIFSYSTVHKKAELGFCLSPEYWGCGLMTEVIKTIIFFMFTHLHLMRLQATADPENVGSMQVLTKCGMQHEGLLHNYYIVHGTCCDRNMYAITHEGFLRYWNMQE